jgi:hypothetical protein
MKSFKTYKNKILPFLAKKAMNMGIPVPFVSEVEEFNAIMGKPNNYTPIIPEEKEWMFVYNFILEELEEYKHACETEILLKFLMLYVILPTFPWGMELCYMVLRIKYGPHIKKYKPRILVRLAQVKKRHKKQLKYVPKSKVKHVTLKKLENIISSIEHVIKK